MQLIEPCCAPKHLLELRGRLGESGTAFFHGYGDLSLAEILPPLLTRYSNVEMTIVAPFLPDAATEAVACMMRRQFAKMSGKGKVDAVGRLTLVTDFRAQKSPAASRWLTDNPFGERLSMHDVQQNDTAILLPDIAFVGNINLAYGGHFTAAATKNPRLIADFAKTYGKLCK